MDTKSQVESSQRSDPLRRILWTGTLTSVVVGFFCVFMEADSGSTRVVTLFLGMCGGVIGGMLGRKRTWTDNFVGLFAIVAIVLIGFAIWSGLPFANEVRFYRIQAGMPLWQVEGMLGPPEWRFGQNTPQFNAVLTEEQKRADYRFAGYPLRVITTFPTAGLPADVRRWTSDYSVIAVSLDEHDQVVQKEYISVEPRRTPRWKVWLLWLTGVGDGAAVEAG